MTRIESIIAFVNVVEQNSFAKAAKLLNLSIPTISRQISELESELGVTLLHRSTRSLALTTFGSEYLTKAKILITYYEDMNKLAFMNKTEPTGKLRIQAPHYSLETYILPYINEFCKIYPKVIPVIEAIEQVPNFNDDFGIVLGASINMEPKIVNSHEIVRRHLFNAKFMLCGSPEYLAKFGIPKTPESLRNHSIISHSRRDNPDIIRLVNHDDVLLTPSLYLNDTYAMIKFAEQGMGLIQITDLYIIQQLRSGQLVEVLSKYTQEIQVFVYYRKNRHLDPKISKFIDFIFSKRSSSLKQNAS